MAKNRLCIFKILLLTGFFSLQAQEISLSGKIMDTLNTPLEYANVLAIPIVNEKEISFTISDAQGRYKLSLEKNIAYSIEISYLGYKKNRDSISLNENTQKDYLLFSSDESLEEVILKQKLAVNLKKDTIVYRTDVFTTGEERKLREVLRKLPGVEVDREGNVKVNGKKVDKFLVEGKPFFTGDTKLGVNNIPADAVDEVEVLDHYTNIPFLKGLSDSEIMAMNIKLKVGKKNFVFGDMEVGGGIKERYLFHPSLFYYSPKTNVNLIGDLNNIGQKSFTFNDYLNFEGGFIKLLENPTGYSNLMNSDFTKYLTNENFVTNKNNFGAFSLSHQLSPKTTLNTYIIANASTTDNREENTNAYLTNSTITNIENRSTTTSANNFFTLSKVSINYIPYYDEDLTYDVVIKSTSGRAKEQLESTTHLDSNFVSSKLKPTSFELNQNLGYSKQFSSIHTTSINLNLNVSSNNNYTDWQFSEPIFSALFPIEGDNPFNILQRVNSKIYNASISLKHYWVLNKFNHIYPIVGYNFSKQEYNTTDQQFVQNSSNNFENFGFNNSAMFQLNDSHLGFQYKAKVGDFILKPGLIYHYYYWKVFQLSDLEATKSKTQLLPELQVNWEPKNSEKVNFTYGLNSRFNNVSFFANRLRLQSFNSLYRGNSTIENELSHNTSLSYYKFSLLRGIFINASVNYNKRVRSIRSAIIIEGIDQINASFYTSLPENNLVLNASFSKKIKTVKFTIATSTVFSDYSRNINNSITNYKSNDYNYNLKAETSFKEFPNIEIGFQQGFNSFSSESTKVKFIQTEPYITLAYDFLKGIIFKSDYTYSLYENNAKSTSNIFQIGNTSLYYNKEDSPWGFEIEINNIFDVNFKNENYFDQFIVNDSRIFIQQRTILFKLSYKL